MTTVFDGKKFAAVKEQILKEQVKKLKIKPRLISILVGNDKASALYTKLKKNAGARIGIRFEIKNFPATVSAEEIINFIKKANTDKKINGIMVQLPLPGKLKTKTQSILRSLAKDKDVDGLTKNSPFMPATIKAINEILKVATSDLPYFGKKAAVVGAKGNVGKRIVEMLQAKGYKVCECDKDTRDLYAKLNGVDLVISATGVPGLIKGEIIKEGAIAIDVGAPIGDFEKSVFDRANFVTPVPGGVGPVTIVCLLENLVATVK